MCEALLDVFRRIVANDYVVHCGLREGYCSCLVCVSVCPSVTALAALAFV